MGEVTDTMLNAASDEMQAQDAAQSRPGGLDRFSNDPACQWVEGYFDLRKIIAAALAAQK
jgi:hypothetical protein